MVIDSEEILVHMLWADSVEENEYDRSLDCSQTSRTFSDFIESGIETIVDSCDVKDGDKEYHSGDTQDSSGEPKK